MKKIAISLICLGILTSGCFKEREERQLKVIAVNKCELIKGEDEYFLQSEQPNAYKINVSPSDIEEKIRMIQLEYITADFIKQDKHP